MSVLEEDWMNERLTECPECGLPAEIVDRFMLTGAPGPVEHVKLVCLAGHWFTPPVDYLPSERAARDIAEPDYEQPRMFEIRTGLDLDG
jgi:hypothetical protein